MQVELGHKCGHSQLETVSETWKRTTSTNLRRVTYPMLSQTECTTVYLQELTIQYKHNTWMFSQSQKRSEFDHGQLQTSLSTVINLKKINK